MKAKLLFIPYILYFLMIIVSCTKKEDNPPEISSSDVISWTKPIEFRSENIFVENLTQTSDGGFMASGNISYTGKSITDGFVLNLNSEGDTLWCRKIRIDFYPNTDILYAIRKPDNEIIIAGVCSYDLFKKQQFVGWLNADGNLTKYVLFPMDDNQIVNDIKVFPVEDGNLYFAVNWSIGQNIEMLGYTLDINLLDKDGNLIRSKTFTGIQTQLDRLYLVKNEDLLLVGSVAKDFPDYADFLFLLIDSKGNEKYRRTFGTTGYDVGYSACPDKNGGYVLAGMTTNLSRPSVYPVNSSGVVSNRVVIDNDIFSNATIILPSADEGYNMIIQSASSLYFKKLGNDLIEQKSWVVSNPNPLYDIRIAFPENDGSVAFLYNTDHPVIVKTIPLN